MGYDSVHFLAVIPDAAIGGEITIPTGGRVDDIEIGKIDGGDAAGGAVHQKPSAALPLPVRRGGGLLGKTVVDAEGAADCEQAVGEVVREAQSEFLDAGVDKKRSNFEGEWLVVCGAGVGGPLDCSPFAESDDVRLGRGVGARLRENDEEWEG